MKIRALKYHARHYLSLVNTTKAVTAAETKTTKHPPERSNIKIITMAEVQKNMSLLIFRDERRLDSDGE